MAPCTDASYGVKSPTGEWRVLRKFILGNFKNARESLIVGKLET